MEKNTKSKIEDPTIHGFVDILKFFKSNVLFLIIIAASCFLVYANLIRGQFVNLDDIAGFPLNPNIGNVPIALKAMDGASLYKALIFKFFGMSSTAYHVSAIFLHVINSILVFLLMYVLFGKKTSLIITFMFITHPTNVEAVGWLSGFPYLLRAIVILSVLLFYSIYKKSNNIKCLFISALIFLVGMLFLRGGGWLFITPFLIVIIDQLVLEKKIVWKNIRIYIPYGIVALIFAASTIPGVFKQRVTDLQTLYYVNMETSTPLINRIPYTIYMAYRLLAYPLELSIYHEGKVLSRPEYAFMVIISVLVIGLIIHFWKKDRVIAGLMMAIIFSILPSFSPIIIAWTAAERYLYIGSALFSAIVAIFIMRADEKYKGKNIAILAAFTIISLYSIRTVFRTNDFKNSKNLWFATRKTAPYSYRVYNNLGDVYADEKSYELALENFKRSVALKPDYADAVHNIGFIYAQTGDIERAKSYLTKALEMNPRLYQSAARLGEIYYAEGDFIKAKSYFQMCIEVDPTSQGCNEYITNLNSMGN
jgi:hypothetical protein